MANIKSAIKRAKVSEKKRARNRPYKTRARHLIADVRSALQAGDLESAQSTVVAAVSALDRAAQKGIIHPNNAARRKSRIMKAVANATKS